MNQKEMLIDLFDHMSWGDSVVWKAVLEHSISSSDEKIKKLFYHLHRVQFAFLTLWKGEKLDLPKIENFALSSSIMKWGSSFSQQAAKVFLEIEDDKLDKIVDIPWSSLVEKKFNKSIKAVTLGEQMMQVAMHSQYHRAQINSRLRELGNEPPMVDFILWVWLGKPKDGWQIFTEDYPN